MAQLDGDNSQFSLDLLGSLASEANMSRLIRNGTAEPPGEHLSKLCVPRWDAIFTEGQAKCFDFAAAGSAANVKTSLHRTITG